MKKLISILLILATLSTLLCACSEKVKVTRGEINDQTYTNESIGVTFTLPSGWRFYTDQEMADLMDITAEMFEDEDLMESAKITTVMDFMAIQTATGNNVNMTVENLQASGNARMTVEKYAEISIDNIKKQLPNAKYTFEPTKTATLADAEFLMLEAACSYNGVNMTQYLYMKKVGNYMIMFTATSVNGTGAETFEKMFS